MSRRAKFYEIDEDVVRRTAWILGPHCEAARALDALAAIRAEGRTARIVHVVERNRQAFLIMESPAPAPTTSGDERDE